jgi:alpha-ribazole phosphatase
MIVALRHTPVNSPQGICYGHSDVPLAASFPEDSKRVGEDLKSFHWDYVFSSPSARCAKLAEALCPSNIKVQTDQRLMELNFGQWELQHWDEIYQQPQAKLFFRDYVNHPCPGGESYAMLIDRVQSFLDSLKSLPVHSQTLVVTHGGPIRAMHVIMKNMDAARAFDIKVGYGQWFVF